MMTRCVSRQRRAGDVLGVISMLGSLLLLMFAIGALADGDGSDYGRWKREQADRRADGMGGPPRRDNADLAGQTAAGSHL